MAEGVAKEAIKKIDSKLECSICLEAYKEPKLLPCFHAFCKSPCLEKLVRHDRERTASLCCPICRHLVTLSERGVAGLQSDFHIDHLVEIREFLGRAQKSSEIQCEKCAKFPAEGFCRDCQKLVCAKCTEIHSMWLDFADHKIVSLTQATAEASKMISPTDKVSYCPRHTKTALKLFCGTCFELICMYCTVRLHKDHNYDLVDDLFAKYKDEIFASLKPVRENTGKVKQALEEFDASARDIDNQRAIVEADIHREIDELHQYLDQRRGELIGELDVLTQQKRKALAAQRDGVEVTLAKHTSCLEYAEGGLETGTRAEVVAMRGAVLKRVSEITTEFDPDTIRPEVSAPIVFVDGKEEVKKTCRENFAVDTVSFKFSTDSFKHAVTGKTLKVGFQTVTSSNKPCVACVRVDAELVHIKSQAKVIVESNHKEHTLSMTPTHRGRHELQVSVNGQAVKGSPFHVSVAPDPASLGKPSRVITGLREPWGVAINSKGHIIVAEIGAHQVSVYDREWRKIRSFGGKGEEHGQFNSPRSVTVDDDDNIYVADNKNHRVQKFTSDGVFNASVGCYGDEKLQFHYPQGVGYNKVNGRIYVTSFYQVQFLNTDLTFHAVFGEGGEGDGEFDIPSGISFDTTGNVLVADYKRVQVLTAEGEFIKKIGTPQQLSTPTGVSTSPGSGMVYVIESGGDRVSMFTATGEYIRSFGSEGSGNGQFKSPVSITIDEDENIIVADRGNNRLQIF